MFVDLPLGDEVRLGRQSAGSIRTNSNITVRFTFVLVVDLVTPSSDLTNSVIRKQDSVNPVGPNLR